MSCCCLSSSWHSCEEPAQAAADGAVGRLDWLPCLRLHGLSPHILTQCPCIAAHLLCPGARLASLSCFLQRLAQQRRLQLQRVQAVGQGLSPAVTLEKDVSPAGAGAAEAAAAPEDADIQTGTIVRFDFSEDAESEALGALKFGTVREAFGGKNAGCRFTQYFTVSAIGHCQVARVTACKPAAWCA